MTGVRSSERRRSARAISRPGFYALRRLHAEPVHRQILHAAGRSLTDTGITPDVEIALSDEDGAKLYYGQLEKADDAQLQAAIREITQKLS